MARLGYVRLSSPWVLSVAPALAYGLAYADRLGEAWAHGVPTDWISVSLTDALSRTAAIVLAVTAMMACTLAVNSWKQSHRKWTHKAVTNLADQVGVIALFALVVQDLRLAAGILGVSLIFTIVMALRDYRKRASFTDDPAATSGVVLLEPKRPTDISETQVKAAWLIGVVAIALVIAPWGGWTRGVMRHDALVTADMRSIVAASYSGSLVLADLIIAPDGTWKVGSKRSCVPLMTTPPTAYVRRSSPRTIQW